MRRDEFGSWLGNRMSKRPVSDYLSRCQRVEKGLNIDLDEEFSKDSGKRLLSELEYSRADQENGKVIPKGLVFSKGADLYNGMSSLKAAVKAYFEYCRII